MQFIVLSFYTAGLDRTATIVKFNLIQDKKTCLNEKLMTRMPCLLSTDTLVGETILHTIS